MPSTIPKSHLFLPEDLPLWELPQIFAASSTWFEKGIGNGIATFDVVVRGMPPNRNFLLFGGLEEIVQGICNWRYSKDQAAFLLDNELITADFADYLKGFKFSGDVWAMPEGTVFFPGEPVVRITAPLVEANLLTMFLFNSVVGNTKFLSKIVRCIRAAEPKPCIGVAGLRAESFESALKCARASYIAGAVFAPSIPQFARKFNIPYEKGLIVVYHAVIKSFPSELEAMRTMALLFNGKASLMVDTYDFETGMENAIRVAKELEEKGLALSGIMLDSGDLFQQSAKARKMLDKRGLSNVWITVAGNLDEYKILKLNRRGIPANAFLIATEAISVPDAPKVEVIYKLAELRTKHEVRYTAKFSQGKESYPGKKQVFRQKENSLLKRDVIGLEEEQLGEPVLVPVIEKGKMVYDLPSLDAIRAHVQNQLSSLPKNLLEIEKTHSYEVVFSDKLKALFNQVKREHS